MITTFLHLADLHLGFKQYGMPERELDFYVMAEELFKLAESKRVNAVILAGDTFDSVKPPALAVWVLRQAVDRLKAVNIPVLGIDGNHDTSNAYWLAVCGVEPLTTTPLLVNGVSVIGIASTYKEQLDRQFDELKLKGVQANMLVLHQPVAEFADFSSDLHVADIVRYAKTVGASYVALGDIHQYKETVVDGVRMVYPGSPEITTQDDADKYTKRAQFVSFNQDHVESTASVPIKPRTFKTVNLETDNDLALLKRELDTGALYVLRIKTGFGELNKAAEAFLKENKVLYRLHPIAGDAGSFKNELAKQTFERKGAVKQLKQAVACYFDTESTEYSLVFKLLDTPENAKLIVTEYMKMKGLV